MNTPIYIPDIFKEVVSRVQVSLESPVYFEYGHYKDVTARLVQKEGAITVETRTKYPLVYFVTDFEEKRLASADWYCELPNLQFIIAMGTSATYTMDERRDNVYLPVLYPIYEAFLEQLSKTKALGYPTTDKIPHSKWDRTYWSGQDVGDGGTLFNDFIDAIQIKGLNLKVKAQKQNC